MISLLQGSAPVPPGLRGLDRGKGYRKPVHGSILGCGVCLESRTIIGSMKNAGRDRWESDVGARQHNLVFPDTAANESRFWRNIISGKEKLSTSQIVGIALMYLTLAAVGYGIISTQMRVSGTQGTLWERIMGNFAGWIILVGIGVVSLLVAKLISRRSTPSKNSSHLVRRK